MHLYPILCLLFYVRAATAQQTADEIQQLLRQHAGNSTALSTVAASPWVDSPKVRGTMDILLTCIVTLFACIYSVLHLNIPAKKGHYSIFFAKLRWVVIALLNPDFVLMVAWRQFFDAIALKNNLRQLRASDPTLPEYDLQFCFFVIMGGFQVSIADIHPSPAFRGDRICPTVVPLSPQGFLKVMNLRHIEGFHLLKNPGSLSDRNKASVFQKIIVMTQVIWMAIQCIVRKTQGFPIALLEVHVMVHVICAVIIYGFWFKKPMDIAEAELLEPGSHEIKGMLALATQSQMCPKVDGSDLVLGEGKPEGPSPTGFNKLGAEEPRVRLAYGQSLECGVSYAKESSYLDLSQADVTRIERAIQYLRQSSEEGIRHRQRLFPHSEYMNCLTRRGNNVPFVADAYPRTSKLLNALVPGLAMSGQHWQQYLVGWLLTLLYGGVHLSARGFRFPTPLEHTLWEVASVVILAAVLTNVLLLTIVVGLVEWGYDKTVIQLGWFFCLLLSALLNIAARIYVIVESFLSLRSLAIGSFAVPVWLQMLPHI